jgi:hypothetical protein
MSYAIENLKFTIFGHGYDSTRADSGIGVTSHEMDFIAYGAMIDETNTYLWVVNGGTGNLQKYRISNMTEVEQSTVPVTANIILHPSNVDNNIGVAFVGGTEVYVFDLTDDTLIGTATGTYPSQVGFESWDCVLINNKIYFSRTRCSLRTSLDLYCLDLSDMSFSMSTIYGSVSFTGFVNNSLLYAYYVREWYYQSDCAYGIGFDGSTQWSNTGINRNENLGATALTGNGYLYMPVRIDDVWHYGVFDGTSNPTFSPVSPIRTFGSFENPPEISASGHDYRVDVAYNNGRTRACVWTQLGLLLTDFYKVETITTDDVVPLALSDRYLVATNHDPYNQKLYVMGI